MDAGARRFRVAEWAGVLAWPVAWAASAMHAAPRAFERPAAALLGVIAGWALSDLVSGVFHWAFDTWGSTATPLIGRTLVRTFREHHARPQEITLHDFVETNGTNALSAITLAGAGAALGGSFLSTMFVVASLGIAATSQIHKWAHSDRVPRWVAHLQRAGVLLGPEHHRRHHAAPHVRAYCITSGWLDAALDGLEVFARVERAVTSLTGARPRRHARTRRPARTRRR